MKKVRLSLAILCICLACAGTLFANGSKESDSAFASSQGKLSFTYMLPGQYMNWLQDLNYWPAMKEESGVGITLVNGGNGDAYYQNIDLQIGSKDIADAVIARQSQTSVYGAQGAFYDLRPLIEKYAPNVKKFIDANPEYAKMITSSNGAIYGLGIINPLYVNLTFYRADHFKKAGITVNPTTIDEFTEDLRKLKKVYGATANYYPWVGRESFLHFAECFDGALDSIDAKGTVHGIYNNGSGNGTGYDIYSDGFRKMVEWYQQLYSEGLIDPEWVAGTGTEEEWQTKYIIGKGSISDDFFSRPSWFMNNGGPESNPEYDVQVMPLFKTQAGKTAHRYTTYVNTSRYFAIPKTSKKAEAVMVFLNWIFSDRGQEVMHYGLEGVNTAKNADGTRQWLYQFGVEAVRPLGETNYGVYQDRLTFPYPVDNDSYYESLDARVQSYCTDYFNTYASYAKQIIYSEEQAQQRSNLMAKYEVNFTAGVLQFVNGTKPINDTNWKEFLDDMEKAGYSQIHDIDQKAYSAMK